MVELPADIRQALAQSRAQSEPSAEDQARVASALAMRLSMPDADWTTPPPSAAKGALAHPTWGATLLAGAGAIGLATTLLVALPALRKTSEGARPTPLTAASTSRAEATPAPEVIAPQTEMAVDQGPDASEPRRRTTRSSRPAHDARPVAQASTSQSAATPRAATRGPATRELQSQAMTTVAPASAATVRASQAPAAHAGARLADANVATVPPPSAADTSRHASLARELALVRAASHALDRGEPQSALQLLNQHAREFADGELAGEREALRLSALCRLGRDAEARALREKLAAELARSPLRARIEHDCAPH